MSLFAAKAATPVHASATIARGSARREIRIENQPFPEALSLLGEVLARLPGVERPVVQIIAASADAAPSHVAFDLAVAAAGHFGRTLLVSASGHESADLTGARELSWRMTALLGGQADTVMPDALISGLYHAQPAAGGSPAKSLPVGTWLSAPQEFRMIVLDCPAISSHPQTLATAALCDGCVLTVAAGVTRLDRLWASERLLASARAPVLGTVLHDAPRIRFQAPWRRRAA